MSQRKSEIDRILRISMVPNPLRGSAAAFLLGPRQTGKSVLLRRLFSDARFFDLLDTRLSAELAVRPGLFRERLLADPADTVVVDEVQKVPALLDEVHYLLENTSTSFVLCGSSARKLWRKSPNLLGGRAVENFLFPLVSAELPDLDLDRMLNHGGLPAHYLVDEPRLLLRSYLDTYIKEEIIDESATRNIPGFSRFLAVVGATHGRQLNYANVARETGVSAGTVRGYYQILEDTLLGFTLEPWRRSTKRRMVETAKFYLFDPGVAGELDPESSSVVEGSDAYGRAFEHFLISEVRAFLSYGRRSERLRYWRTSSGREVDLIVGEMRAAFEFKSSREVRGRDLAGMRALLEEHDPPARMIVCREERSRVTDDGIRITPWQEFCADLWKGALW